MQHMHFTVKEMGLTYLIKHHFPERINEETDQNYYIRNAAHYQMDAILFTKLLDALLPAVHQEHLEYMTAELNLIYRYSMNIFHSHYVIQFLNSNSNYHKISHQSVKVEQSGKSNQFQTQKKNLKQY